MTGAGRKSKKRPSVGGLVWKFMIALLVMVSVGTAVWLVLPASNATIGISANTGSLTVEPLCGERLVWDLPPGRIGPRSALPGSSPALAGNVTLVVAAGGRARIVSTGPATLYIAVERTEIARNCGVESAPPFQVSLDGMALADDPLGFSYSATAPATGQSFPLLSLPLSGHILLGQAVQQGAGWAAGATGILQSGTVTLRVVPKFSDERVTLSTEPLDEGSLLDTHACLEGATGGTRACPSRDAVPARGFLRTLAGGGLSAQIYARGPVGVQAYSGAEQHLLKIPNSTAAWRSEILKIVGAALVMLFALWKHLIDIRNFLTGKTAKVLHDIEAAEHQSVEILGEQKKSGDPSPPVRLGMVPLFGVIALALAATTVLAEPVEIRQDTLVGAGASFRRGAACLVVTARHVVAQIGVPVTVLDRTGAKAEASRSYDNESYDLALVTLRDNPSTVACTTTWPDAGWLQHASLSPSSEFYVVRHYPGGKETIVRLRYAGGDKAHLTLAPVDKLNIRESDSGAIVMFEDRPAGIVQSVSTGDDRINVLRFDVIDQLVGDRFRAGADGHVVSYAGVLSRGRVNPTWSTYVQAWLTEKGGRTVIPVPVSRTAAAEPPANCEVKVEVLSWDRVAAPNPEYDTVQLQLKACGKRGIVFEQLCKQAQQLSASTPRQVQSQKIALNVTVTPPGAAPLSKLTTTTHLPRSGFTGTAPTQAEIELGSLQAAVAPSLKELLTRGGCE